LACLKSEQPSGSVGRAGEVPADYYGLGYLSVMTSIPALLGKAARDLVALSNKETNKNQK
jgi:hypothetical protein